tara:strand:+ start:2003 stop:3748 length:1746 start_codon:yes stop_codon:yes gene_type:complete
MEVHYKKNKNEVLFQEFAHEKLVNMEDTQNYLPIYQRFFNLNTTNYNSINLNNYYRLDSIKEKLGYSIFNGSIVDNSDNITNRKIFIKYSPLIDPVKYMIGKYDNCYNTLQLPTFGNDNVIFKILDTNNSAYSDGFFSFLSSLLLNKYNFINGIDYYGSFLGMKNNFTVDIEDDLEYLDDSEFFHEKNNVLFEIEETKKYKNLFSNTKKNKPILIIDEKPISEEEFEISNLYEDNDENNIGNIETINDINDSSSNQTKLEVEYTKINIETFPKKKVKTNEQNESSSSCSSRYSNTNSSKNNDSEYDEDDQSDNHSDDDSYTSSQDDSEEELLATIFQFPVQAIALECCEDTLDSYIINNKIKDNEWESIILQIVLSLITYQKVFNFTHNDLHTNNVVYTNTEKKYLYYKYDNKHYKVPTFGKIYKIIDFGRAIYTFKGNLICSDSYAPDGDAYTQYNMDPYLNENKKRIDPNYSFDLCRLGCSLFDYFIEDIDEIEDIRSPIKKIIINWVFDDVNKNILYKNNGNERYPDFKLYKMIARTVNNHTPQNIIKKPVFEKYLHPKKKINNQSVIFNIDTLPIMT